MLLRSEAICSATVRDFVKASESNLQTRLSLWHGRDREDVVKMAQIKNLTVKLPVFFLIEMVRHTYISYIYNPRASLDISILWET